jgi:hypothetical protein
MDTAVENRPRFCRSSLVSRFFGLFFLLFLNTPTILFAGIVLQVSPTEGYIEVRIVEPKISPSLVTDVCDVYVIAKHRSIGYLYLSYSPLSDGNRVLEYQLLDENNQILPQDSRFIYQLDGAVTQHVPFGRIRARFPTGMQRMQSTLTFHLVLEL